MRIPLRMFLELRKCAHNSMKFISINIRYTTSWYEETRGFSLRLISIMYCQSLRVYQACISSLQPCRIFPDAMFSKARAFYRAKTKTRGFSLHLIPIMYYPSLIPGMYRTCLNSLQSLPMHSFWRTRACYLANTKTSGFFITCLLWKWPICCDVGVIAKWSDHSTFVERVSGSKPSPSRPLT